MKEVLDFIKELHPMYAIMLVSGGIGGIAAHFVNRKKYEKFWGVTAVYAAGLLLAFLAAYTLNGVFNRRIAETYGKHAYYLTEFSFLYTVTFFVLIVKIFSLILGWNFEKIREPFAASILVFLCLAKFGCFLNGCCVSKPIGGVVLHLNLYESGFALLLAVLYFWKKRRIFYPFFLTYLTYRFLAEFIRESYAYQKVGAFTGAQIVAVSFLLILILCFLFEKIKKKNA